MTADDMERIIESYAHKELFEVVGERLIRIAERETEMYDVICRKIEDNIWLKSKELVKQSKEINWNRPVTRN